MAICKSVVLATLFCVVPCATQAAIMDCSPFMLYPEEIELGTGVDVRSGILMAHGLLGIGLLDRLALYAEWTHLAINAAGRTQYIPGDAEAQLRYGNFSPYAGGPLFGMIVRTRFPGAAKPEEYSELRGMECGRHEFEFMMTGAFFAGNNDVFVFSAGYIFRQGVDDPFYSSIKGADNGQGGDWRDGMNPASEYSFFNKSRLDNDLFHTQISWRHEVFDHAGFKLYSDGRVKMPANSSEDPALFFWQMDAGLAMWAQFGQALRVEIAGGLFNSEVLNHEKKYGWMAGCEASVLF